MRAAFLRSYHPGKGNWRSRDFRQLAAEIRCFAFDALLVADALPAGGKLVHDLVRMGVTQPILGTDKLDPEGLRQHRRRARGPRRVRRHRVRPVVRDA